MKKINLCRMALLGAALMAVPALVSCKGGSKGGAQTAADGAPASVEAETFTVKGVSFKMVKVAGGTFTMGATAEQGSEAQPNEQPAHEVTVGDFYIGQTEVTQALWEAVMGSNPSHTQWPECPVNKISWQDCNDFADSLTALTGKKFRLPTEAEWEYAARGGSKSKGYKYAGSNNINEVAWTAVNSEEKPHPVAGKAPNELGLYDMSGNVSEWCSDKLLNYDGTEPQYSQKMLKSERKREFHIIRGGSWNYGPTMSRTAYRGSGNYTRMFAYDGLRVVMECPAAK